MKIIRLEAENFKRLRAVSITPDGTLQQITGRNAQGKTSLLDVIEAALCGGRSIPDRPIRDGEKRAEVMVDLGDIVVRRKWTSNERSTLTVESKDGLSHKKPQDVLDRLLGDLSFDPLAFTRLKPKEQADALRKIAGLDTTLLDGQRKGAFDKRTDANRALKTEQSRLDALPLVEAPDEPVSVKALLTELEDARGHEEERQRVIRSHGGRNDEHERVLANVERLEKELASAKQDLGYTKQKLDEAAAAVKTLPEPIDTAEIKARIDASESTNEKVRAKQERARQIERVKAANEDVLKLEQQLETIDARKKELLEGAAFPVPGLSVDGDTPTFNNVPLAQASGAEQLRVSLAIAGAQNPKLRVILVRDGSLLDADGLRMVAAWAAEKGQQVFLERVSDGAGVGIVIEDGMVADGPITRAILGEPGTLPRLHPDDVAGAFKFTPMELQRELPSEADEIQGRDPEPDNDFPTEVT